jgi:hypothetical protein
LCSLRWVWDTRPCHPPAEVRGLRVHAEKSGIAPRALMRDPSVPAEQLEMPSSHSGQHEVADDENSSVSGGGVQAFEPGLPCRPLALDVAGGVVGEQPALDRSHGRAVALVVGEEPEKAGDGVSETQQQLVRPWRRADPLDLPDEAARVDRLPDRAGAECLPDGRPIGPRRGTR